MSQGTLQASLKYQTVICELTGMDVSNASGYDGTTVSADACFVAKHVTDRQGVVLAESLNPQVRQVVKTYAPGFGFEVVEVPHRDGVTDPAELGAAAAADAAAVNWFQQPNFLGCLEDCTCARGGRERGGCCRSRVDLALARRARGAGCVRPMRSPSARGSRPGTGHRTAVPTTGSWLRARTTSDGCRDGSSARPSTRKESADSSSRSRPASSTSGARKATSNMTTNQTLLALAGLATLSWLGPEGLREVGETCLALSSYVRERIRFEPVFAAGSFKEVAFRTPLPAREVIGAPAGTVNPGYALGRDYEGMDDVLLVAPVTEKKSVEDVDSPRRRAR